MSEEEIKKEVLKAIELYIEGGKNPAGGAGKKAFAQWATCPTMKTVNLSLFQSKLYFQLWIQ